MTQQQAKWVSVSEAVGVLGKSERTLRRWIASERLPTRDSATGLEVDIAGEVPDEVTQAEAPPDSDTLLVEIRHLQAQIEALRDERDYLRQALASALGTQHLLAERTVTAEQARPWWRFWERQ